MICDLSHPDPLPAFAADVCIVGAGAAGLTLAADLIRQGRRVLLLESGGSHTEAALQQLNAFSWSGQTLHSSHAGRFRVLGGTTTKWGGQILPYYDEDFQSRDWIAGSGWPITKKNLDPYYARALQAEGLADVLPTDAEVWQHLGSAAPKFGDDLLSYFTRWCPEPDFSRLHRQLFSSLHLCVVLHATVCALQLNADGTALTGVECRDLSGQQHVFRAPQYALCLGTMETVQLLLQPPSAQLSPSEARPPSAQLPPSAQFSPSAQLLPWQRNGLLGQHLQSHIDYNAARIMPMDRAGLHTAFSNVYLQQKKYHPKLRLSPLQQAQQQVLNIAGSVIPASLQESALLGLKTTARNLLRGHLSAVQPRDLASALRQLPLLAQLGLGYLVHHRAHWPHDATFWLRVHCEQEPTSASRITLSSQRNAIGIFGAHVDWRVSALEWKTIQCFTATVQASLARSGLGTLVPQPELAFDDGYRSVTFDDSYHWMGGTRMSVSPADGVVDPQLRLHGLRNAYVCSSSADPTSGFSNPTHTLLALALRLADHLVQSDSQMLPR